MTRNQGCFTVAALALALAACGGKSETEQLAAMREGLVYTQYRNVSENALLEGLAAYRKGLQWTGENWAGGKLPADLPKGELSKADLCVTHVLLAYGALIADKRSIALAESDIVDAQQCNTFDRAAASSLRSVVFQREQWPGLAKQESDKAWALPNQAGETQPPVEHVIVMHVALAYFAASEQEWERAQVHFDALAQLLKQPWFSQLPAAGIAFKEGRTQDGLVALKKLSRDPSAPEAVRKELVAFIAKVEAKGGDVDSMVFMPRLVAVLGWEAIQAEGPQLLRTVTGFAEDQAWAAAGGSVKEGADKAQKAAAGWWQKARDAVSSADKTPKPDSGDADKGRTDAEAAPK
ncbi:hypothetical protein [Pseudomonas sp. CGJS7]|uniref:hypothetical protein n=1 Tax=Pseudomonas sp. CGJS7 TaxID=3109348 RepID=UPI00300BB9EB